jgi:prepilin-type N-terminal cleavage/methylation domain-containing protein
MSLKSKLTNKSQSGFTIVELLIVIVVIGILAAITIVAYNGVTARANTTSAQAAAGSALKKAEAYNVEEAGYPATPAALTGAAASEVYNLTGVTFTDDVAAPTTVPGASSELRFYTCTAGTQVSYWNYTTGAWVDQTTGDCTGTPVYVAA